MRHPPQAPPRRDPNWHGAGVPFLTPRRTRCTWALALHRHVRPHDLFLPSPPRHRPSSASAPAPCSFQALARVVPGCSHRDAIGVHEERVDNLLGAKLGHRALDVRCDVGGPMRSIAVHSGSHIIGITINEYQVNHATRWGSTHSASWCVATSWSCLYWKENLIKTENQDN